MAFVVLATTTETEYFTPIESTEEVRGNFYGGCGGGVVKIL